MGVKRFACNDGLVAEVCGGSERILVLGDEGRRVSPGHENRIVMGRC